jgi:hypothetical protein
MVTGLMVRFHYTANSTPRTYGSISCPLSDQSKIICPKLPVIFSALSQSLISIRWDFDGVVRRSQSKASSGEK